MNSGIMNVHHNDPENFIDDTEYFLQYCSWLLCGHEGNTNQKNTTQVSTAQLDWGSNPHAFTNTTMFNYTRAVNFNVQIINGGKAPAKVFDIVIVNITETNIIISLWLSHYTPQRSKQHYKSNFPQTLQSI